jgi:endonuclease G
MTPGEGSNFTTVKNPIPLFALLLLVLQMSAQDSRFVPDHEGLPLINADYLVDFDTNRGIAHWVAYELLPVETLGETKRKSGFKGDNRIENSPLHKDYTKSGYDRGHMKPAADSKSSESSMADSFLMSNVAPQTPSLNRGSWKQLEETARDWSHEHGAIYVVCGPGEKDLSTLGSGQVGVPDEFWKAVLRVAPDTACIAFLMPNTMEKLNTFPSYRISVDSLEQRIGIDLFPQLPDATERRIEQQIDSHWTGLED